MAKVIAEKIVEAPIYESGKQVEIKHTRTMKDAAGNDVEVVDYVDIKPVDEAISQCETHKANLESQLSECEAELADYIAIRDAE
jgi:hypothetical protein